MLCSSWWKLRWWIQLIQNEKLRCNAQEFEPIWLSRLKGYFITYPCWKFNFLIYSPPIQVIQRLLSCCFSNFKLDICLDLDSTVHADNIVLSLMENTFLNKKLSCDTRVKNTNISSHGEKDYFHIAFWNSTFFSFHSLLFIQLFFL